MMHREEHRARLGGGIRESQRGWMPLDTEHARATTLVAKERGKAKENCRTTTEVIEQVEAEFRI